MVLFIRNFSLFSLFALAPLSSHATPVPTNQVRAVLAKFEGEYHYPYRDNGGTWCAGIGHRITGVPQLFYSQRTVDKWFKADLERARTVCRRGITQFDSLPWDAQIVALQLAFCVGNSGFMRFEQFRKWLSHRDYRKAARELKNSKWWGQVGEARAREVWNRLVGLE